MRKTKNADLGLAWKAGNAHAQTFHSGCEGIVRTADPNLTDVNRRGMTRLYPNSPKLETQIPMLDGMDAEMEGY